MKIDIELDEITDCKKCGIVFNMYKCRIGREYETDFEQTVILIYQCPVCKHEDKFWCD